MPAVLNTNMASLYAQKSLSTAQADLASSVQKLSSGKRINSAKDDAAGFAVSEAVKATKNITDQSIQNTQDAISLAQTAEGALDVVSKILQRVMTLVTEKQNGSLTGTATSGQIGSVNSEIATLLSEVSKVSSRTKFQGGTGATSIFSASTLTFATGESTTATLTIGTLTLAGLGITAASEAAVTQTEAGAITTVNIADAVQSNIASRSALGAQQNRLNYTVDNMQTLSNNLADSASRITDTDYASETAKLTRGQILQQAATSMLAQANQMPNVILTLLK
jgi:flagellin